MTVQPVGLRSAAQHSRAPYAAPAWNAATPNVAERRCVPLPEGSLDPGLIVRVGHVGVTPSRSVRLCTDAFTRDWEQRIYNMDGGPVRRAQKDDIAGDDEGPAGVACHNSGARVVYAST